MVNALMSIVFLLQGSYPDLSMFDNISPDYDSECLKSEYLINYIYNILTGSNNA
jgi:hypothetical protein